MATPQAILSRSVRVQSPRGQDLAPGAREDLEVILDEGRRVRLLAGDEKSAAYAQILSGLEKLRQPVYLEVDPDTEAIGLLRVPDVGRVRQAREAREGIEFEIDSSHARFVLGKSHKRFEQLSEMLREADRSKRPLILTIDDRHEVIDARFFEPGPDDGPLPDFPLELPRPAPDWYGFLRWWIWPWNWWFRGCISVQHAQQVFDQMSATSCAPLTVPAPCIPFLYPDDGCWARAHEMCRLMLGMGLSPRKVWIQGSLHTPTRNNPFCFVNWGWHVAPTLCVRRARCWRLWIWCTEKMVIDPSLFTTPVSVSQWKSVQGDPNAALTYTAASDYLWGQTDPGYVKTNDRLAYYRLRLQERAVNSGPPPYANCP
jgi:hypothetical protein